MHGSMSIQALRRIDPKVKIVAVSGLTEYGKAARMAGFIKTFLANPIPQRIC